LPRLHFDDYNPTSQKSSAVTVTIKPSALVVVKPNNDLSNSVLCHEISYTVSKSSSLVSVNLCSDEANLLATLEVGTKSKTGKLTYVVVKKQVLDGNGVTLFKLNTALKTGQVIRISANGKLRKVVETVNL